MRMLLLVVLEFRGRIVLASVIGYCWLYNTKKADQSVKKLVPLPTRS